MKAVFTKRTPPGWVVFPVFAALILTLSLISIAVINLLNLPLFVMIPRFLAVLLGIFLLVAGFLLLFSSLKTLTLKRAFGREMYKPGSECKLITTGIYAYTRNPIGFSSTILFSGWFFIFESTFLLILTILFIIFYCSYAKWEEKELTERFGEEYAEYKKTVPFFVPYPRKWFK